ncbi:MAG: hypothetical protein JNK02_07195 [Planctomycetes bacterium]|nr:hypothetical protein [Planctomycetota bacterium]
MNLLRLLAAAVAASACALCARADFTSALAPPFRGDPCARFDGFETFAFPHAAPNAPDVLGSDATATITQLVPGAILTSTGNIYHPFAPPSFRIEAAFSSGAQEIVLHVAALGHPHDATTFALTFATRGGASGSLPPASVSVLVAQPQVREELRITWDLRSAPAPVTSLAITWAASQANSSLDAVLLDVLLECPPGVALCFGDGSGVACPCANTGAAGHGCASSVNPDGGRLGAWGVASVGADTLVLAASGMPNSSALYFQGTSATQVTFGDGLRCAAGAILRIGTRSNSAGRSQVPGPGDAPVSVRGQVGSGATRVYQAWYRNAADYCTSATFNLTNAYQITWSS